MRKKEKKKTVKSEEGEGIGSRQVKPAGCCRVLADGKLWDLVWKDGRAGVCWPVEPEAFLLES